MSTTHGDYIARMKLELDRLNVRMNVLQAGASEAKAESHQKYNSEMSKLRHQSRLVLANLDEISTAGEEGWNERVAEVERLCGAFSPWSQGLASSGLSSALRLPNSSGETSPLARRR
ncbi:MAG: hypothetical protein ABIR94_12125 [Rubrivivax sp.]